MKTFLLLCSVLLGTAVVFANDMSIVGVGGSVHPLRGQHPQIRMVREKININVGKSTYDVQADFIFHNRGKATTVKMGFPESGGGADVPSDAKLKKSTFITFSSSVDGQKIPVRRVLLSSSTEEYDAVWIKKVPFKSGQTRHVRVKYRTALGGAAGVGLEQLVGYDFTGGNWAGDVKSSVLTVHFKQPGDYLLSAMLGDKKVHGKIDANKSTFIWKNWQAQGSFLLRFIITAPQWMVNSRFPGSANELQNFATLKVAGAPPLQDRRFNWFPPAFYYHGLTYISLGEFCDDISTQSPELHPSISWNAATRTATLKVQNKNYTFQPESLAMKKGDSREVLPAAPMLIRWYSDDNEAKLYVPFAPLMLALGGTYHVNREAHRYRFDLPQSVNSK